MGSSGKAWWSNSMLIHIFALFSAGTWVFISCHYGNQERFFVFFLNPDRSGCHSARVHKAKADTKSGFVLKVLFQCWISLSCISLWKSSCQWVRKSDLRIEGFSFLIHSGFPMSCLSEIAVWYLCSQVLWRAEDCWCSMLNTECHKR